MESIVSSDSEAPGKRRGKLGDLLFSGDHGVAEQESSKVSNLKALLSQAKSKST